MNSAPEPTFRDDGGEQRSAPHVDSKGHSQGQSASSSGGLKAANSEKLTAARPDHRGSSAEEAHAEELEREREASNLEDLQWVEETLTGDPKAYDQIYLKHRDAIVGTLFQVLRHREDSLEATQEVFLKAYRAIGRFQPGSRFFPWLYRIAVNHGIDLIRRRKVRKEQRYEGEFEVVPEDPTRSRFPNPARALHETEVHVAVHRALGELAEKHREVFVLFSFEDKNYGEISEILEIPIGTVMSRLFYARKKLKAALPSEWDPGGRKRREKRDD